MTSLLKSSLKTILKSASSTCPPNLLVTRQITLTTPAAQTFRKWYQSLWAPRSPPNPPYEHITQVGDPVLRRKAVDVPAEAITGPEVKYLVRRMVHVLHKYKCVGLAAPQIGSPLNIMVMEFSQKALEGFAPEIRKAKRMEVLPLTVSNIIIFYIYSHVFSFFKILNYRIVCEFINFLRWSYISLLRLRKLSP